MGVDTIDEITNKFKVGCAILLFATLLQIIGLGSSHWSLTKTDEFGTVAFSGLWEKCSDLNMGVGDDEEDFKCQGFIWEDVQVSHWFRTVQTMQVLGLFGMLGVVVMLGMYIFLARIRGWSILRYFSIALCFMCGIFILSTCIAFASLKDVLKARQMPTSYVKLSWSWAFCLIASILDFVCGVMFIIGK